MKSAVEAWIVSVYNYRNYLLSTTNTPEPKFHSELPSLPIGCIEVMQFRRRFVCFSRRITSARSVLQKRCGDALSNGCQCLTTRDELSNKAPNRPLNSDNKPALSLLTVFRAIDQTTKAKVLLKAVQIVPKAR